MVFPGERNHGIPCEVCCSSESLHIGTWHIIITCIYIQQYMQNMMWDIRLHDTVCSCQFVLNCTNCTIEQVQMTCIIISHWYLLQYIHPTSTSVHGSSRKEDRREPMLHNYSYIDGAGRQKHVVAIRLTRQHIVSDCYMVVREVRETGVTRQAGAEPNLDQRLRGLQPPLDYRQGLHN